MAVSMSKLRNINILRTSLVGVLQRFAQLSGDIVGAK